MRPSEIKNHIDISKIDWDQTPQKAHAYDTEGFLLPQDVERFMEEINKNKDRDEYMFYINVCNMSCSLHLMHNLEDNSIGIDSIEDIPEKLLIEAVQKVGMINMSGHYPITPQIITWLKKAMEKDVKIINGVEYYSTQEVTRILNLSLKTIQSKCKSGEIKSKKWGRNWYISQNAIDEFINGN
jgi:excisionase family DNA binding protein